jgi:hypothetical protein
MRKKIFPGLLCCFVMAGLHFSSCTHQVPPSGTAVASKSGAVNISSPPCIIYRTTSDYSRYVPVMLSADKSRIESYPDIKDIYFNGKLSVPTLLANGFLLDNRGIGLQVAFLDYTYEDYSRLSSTPNATILMSHLLDKDPLVEMYQCKQRSQYTDIEKELNALINSGNLNTCKKLK